MLTVDQRNTLTSLSLSLLFFFFLSLSLSLSRSGSYPHTTTQNRSPLMTTEKRIPGQLKINAAKHDPKYTCDLSWSCAERGGNGGNTE